ncbi:hypothetical protein [Cellulomonas telluris]|uniref:hypothetical protein n=1 Tax=Cellulomonas telluris TaxID=2306636 RepID=UPI0010A7FCFD|nr:hypothetical protein [Cellulomonas telluris]
MAGRGLAGLSPGMKAFLAVDVVLVVVLVVLLFALRGGGPDEGAAGGPTATGTAAPTGEATAEPEPVSFVLPSGNIGCDMTAGGVECRIASFTYAPPQVAGCEGTTGNVVRLDAQGFAFACVEDEPPAVAAPGATRLEYGRETTVGDWTCGAGTDGVTCTGPGGVGFRLARADWSELP